jgi:antitoxin (DNA-binding transcriptional repressor) of toxin-antitoxin stability system
MEVGLREANQRFSAIIKAVRRGEEVLLTKARHAARPASSRAVDRAARHHGTAA